MACVFFSLIYDLFHMEELTKQQIVLVTLLVSFVTSIGTGIVTVALMDQAPPGVTQTINRVVERTIEKVVPGPTQQAAVITKETVVVKEDDLVVQAIDKNSKSIVSIIKVLVEGETAKEIFVGNGLVVSKDGLIASDASILEPLLDDNQNPIKQTLKAVLSDGTVLSVANVSGDTTSGIVLLKPTLDDKTKKAVFIPASLAEALSLKLGQTVIALGGEKVSVAVGIVSNISHAGIASSQDAVATSTDAVSASKPLIIKTDISAPGKTLGAILVNLSGDVVGIRAIIAGNSDTSFISSSIISSAIKLATKTSSSQ